MVEEVREYQQKRFAELRTQLEMARANPAYDPVHQWRISFKKIRAMHHLMAHLSNHDFDPKADLAPLKPIFSAAGRISDCQAQKPLVSRLLPLYPMQGRQLLDKLDKAHEKYGEKLRKEMAGISAKQVDKLEKRVMKRIDQHSDKLNIPGMWAFGSKQMMDAAQILTTNNSDAAFHEVRILMKESFYTFKRLEKRGVDLTHLDIQELDLCLVKIGEWHDWQVLYEQHEHRLALRSLILRVHYEARERRKVAETALRSLLEKLHMLKTG